MRIPPVPVTSAVRLSASSRKAPAAPRCAPISSRARKMAELAMICAPEFCTCVPSVTILEPETKSPPASATMLRSPVICTSESMSDMSPALVPAVRLTEPASCWVPEMISLRIVPVILPVPSLPAAIVICLASSMPWASISSAADRVIACPASIAPSRRIPVSLVRFAVFPALIRTARSLCIWRPALMVRSVPTCSSAPVWGNAPLRLCRSPTVRSRPASRSVAPLLVRKPERRRSRPLWAVRSATVTDA